MLHDVINKFRKKQQLINSECLKMHGQKIKKVLELSVVRNVVLPHHHQGV